MQKATCSMSLLKNKIINFQIITDPQNTIALIRTSNGDHINLFCKCIDSCSDASLCARRVTSKITKSTDAFFDTNDPDSSVVYLARRQPSGFEVSKNLSSYVLDSCPQPWKIIELTF